MNIRKRGNDSQLRWGRGSSRGLWWGSKAQALDSYRFVRNSLLWFQLHGLGPHSRVLVQSVPSSAQQRAPCPLTVLRRHTSSAPQTVHANKVLCYQLFNNKNEKRTEFSPCLRFPCVHLLLPIRSLFLTSFFWGKLLLISLFSLFRLTNSSGHPTLSTTNLTSLTFCFPDLSLLTYFST